MADDAGVSQEALYAALAELRDRGDVEASEAALRKASRFFKTVSHDNPD